MQRSRRTNPYPFTWEVPVLLLVVLLFLLLMALQTGRTLANLLTGNGWVFIDRPHLFTSAPGILAGDPAAGLPVIANPASPKVLWACVGGVELATLIGFGAGLGWGMRRWGPSRLRGVATRAEAEALLGRSRLRQHATVIRPDLYGAGPGHGGRS